MQFLKIEEKVKDEIGQTISGSCLIDPELKAWKHGKLELFGYWNWFPIKHTVDECYKLIGRLDQEQKVRAIDKWNETSEKLQHVVNESFMDVAESIGGLEGNEDKHLKKGVSIVAITSPLPKSKVVHFLGKKSANRKISKEPAQDQAVTVTLQSKNVNPIEEQDILTFECKDCYQIFDTNASLSKHECSNVSEAEKDEDQDVDDQEEHAVQMTESNADDGDEAVYVNQHPKPIDESSRRIVRKGGDGQNEVVYQCEFCQKTFVSSHQLSAHRWFHTKPFTCHICRMRFPAKANLVVHIRSHTGEKPFSCSHCAGRFSTRGNLRRHERTHTGEKPWVCNICNSRFTENKSLRIHLRRHTGERPYECQTCGKRFSQAGILSVHMAVHQEKTHKCEICEKTFRQKGQLKIHMQRHQGIRSYLCQICHQAKFVTKEDLARHIRVHTGEKPYVCHVCDKGFARQETLKEHVAKHTTPSYTCKECGKQFVHRSSCFRHCKTHVKIRVIVQKYQGEKLKMEKGGASKQALEDLHSKYLEDVQTATAEIVDYKVIPLDAEKSAEQNTKEEPESMTFIITDPEMDIGEREEYIIIKSDTTETAATNPE